MIIPPSPPPPLLKEMMYCRNLHQACKKPIFKMRTSSSNRGGTGKTNYLLFLVSCNFSPQPDLWSCCRLQKLFFGMSSRASKIIPKTGDVGKLHLNANNVIRPPPPFLLRGAMICHVFIPLWQIRCCSRMGAALVHATALPDFCLGLIFT
jgi:hypothetical protein